MIKNFGKTLAVGAVAAMAMVGIHTSASAAIIGTANYDYLEGFLADPTPATLELKLDGVTIYTDASPTPGTITLSTASPGAFAALVAVLRNDVANVISTLGFGLPEVAVSDFNYSAPNSDDLQGSGTISEIYLTINQFESEFISTPFGSGYLAQYNIDIDVEAVPVPGAIISGLSGLALMGFVASRRKRSA